MGSLRRLRLVLGDQLQHDSLLPSGAGADADRLVMIEAPGEATHVWSHRARIALFLSAMRHFADELRRRGVPLEYIALDDRRFADHPGLAERLSRLLVEGGTEELSVVEPGEWRLREEIAASCGRLGVKLAVLPDRHFLCSTSEFAAWARGKRKLRMEPFYRWMRRRHRVLLDAAGAPLGGRWSFDAENRGAFPKGGPGRIAAPAVFPPDEITRRVFALVEKHFPEHPGSLDHFAWPVARPQALKALSRFVGARLQRFGSAQDAMWTGTPFGWHAILSSSLNLKLLHPLEVVRAAERAYRSGSVPIASAEGFIRQVLGWREFMRGAYWRFMPELARANHFGHARALPSWYWTGRTHMACMRECIGQTLRYGFAHHIQRLMVTGQFALLAEIDPRQVCDWYLAVYVDAVEWAELPNTAGMALFADGGRFTSKPYVASGQYIRRQSNYCAGCDYQPRERVGSRACPFTALYWNFLDRHQRSLATNPRTALMVRNVARLEPAEREAIRRVAAAMLDHLDAL